MSITTKLNGLQALLHFENRWQLIFNRLFFRKGIQIYRYGGMQILIDHEGGDACGTRMCLTSDMYRKYLRHMILGKNINVIDMGANGGGFPLMLRAEGVGIGRLVCAELNPLTYQRLVFNVKTNICAEAECINAAICGHDGEVFVSLGKGGTSDSVTMADPRSTCLVNCRISCTTFDSLYRRYCDGEIVDICKIDIEGSEYDIFLNAGHDSIRRCRYVIMEIHPGDAIKRVELDRELQRLGFSEIDTDYVGDNVHFFSNLGLNE